MEKYGIFSIKTRSKSKTKTNEKILEYIYDPIKKPKSPYYLWSEKERIKLKEKIKDNKQLLKELGNLWNKMPESDKNFWKELSDIEKENYNKKLNSIFSEENDVKLNLKNDKDDNKIFKKIILRNSKKKLAETCQSKKPKLK